MTEAAVPRNPLDAFHLKIIALAAMIVDYTGAALPVPAPAGPLMRSIGRIAFPLYAFFIAEGCRHTRSRERYLLRLGLLALASEIPFDLAFHNWGIDFLSSTNIFYTLFLAVACIHIYETLRAQPGELQPLGPACAAAFLLAALLMRRYTRSVPAFLLLCLLYLAAMLGLCSLPARKQAQGRPDRLAGLLAAVPMLPILFLAELIRCDYGGFGVALIVLIYIAKSRPAQAAVLALGVFFKYGMVRWGHIVSTPHSVLSLACAMLSVVLVCFYNGERGRAVKWPFYWAYPVHIAILAAIKPFFPI